MFAGIAGTAGGFCILVYQALMYLMHDTWIHYSLLTLIESGPQGLSDWVYMNPVILNFLDSCPLFIGLAVFGLILLFIASKLRNRYS